MEEGLPSLCVYDIIQSKDGAIWFATDNGVSRFDGYKFKYFGVAEGLSHPDVFTLHEDHRGRIWCGVMNNELCYIENGEVIRPAQTKALSGFFDKTAIIQGLVVRGNELFIGYKLQGLIHIDAKGKIKRIGHQYGAHIFLTGENENVVGRVSKLWGPNIWDFPIYMYDETGLVAQKTVRFKSTEIGVAAPKWSSYGGVDSMSILGGRYKIVIKGNECIASYPEEICNQQIESQGWIWKGSEKDGIKLVNHDLNIESHLFPGKPQMPELSDKDGNVWVVERGKAVYCFKPLKVLNYSNGDELLSGVVSDICVVNNQLALGYMNGWMEKLSVDSLSDYWNKKGESFVTGIHWMDGELYVHSLKEVVKYDGRGNCKNIESVKRSERNLFVNSYRRIINYTPSLYSMVGGVGICVWDKESNTILFDSSKSGASRIQDQLVDHQKNIWTTSEKGVCLFDVESETLIPFVTNLSVVGIVQLNNNDIWCSVGDGGIVQFIPSKKKTVKVDLGKLVNQTFIKHLRKDVNGIIWGTSNKGLFRINPDTRKVELIQKSDGLLSNLLTDIVIDGDELYVTSSKGVSRLNINETFKSENAPVLSVNKVRLNGEEIHPNILKRLNYDENNLEFRFVAIGFETPGDYNYRYRLKGLSDSWQYTKELKALFLSIPSGSYEFEVEVFDPSGAWSVRRSIELSVSLPFWETWWFISGIILLMVSIIFYIYKRRIRKLEQTNQLKYEIKKFQQHALTAQMNPHFIFNSMNSIQRFILENERLIANEYLVKFSTLMRLTLENSKKIWVPIEDELKALKLYLELEALRFKNKLNWKIEVAESVDQSLKIPTLLIQPFVENSIWHGLMHKQNGGTVKIIIKDRDGKLFCEVVDDGVGRDRANGLKSMEHKTMKSTGISITQRRLELLHDESRTTFLFTIEDLNNERGQTVGTRVYFSIPTVE